MTRTRKEYDSLGVVNVPINKLWGPQTERSRNNFKIGKTEVCQLKSFDHFLY